MDRTMYFSFNGTEPIFITSILLSSGQIRTEPSSWTDEELADVGATGPYFKPAHDTSTEELEWDSDALTWNVVPRKVEEISEVEMWNLMRSQRNARLVETDQLMHSDYPITEEEKDNLLAYRKALRDFPSTITDPLDFTWPTPPQCIIDHFNLDIN